jgi:hypothetical protein
LEGPCRCYCIYFDGGVDHLEFMWRQLWWWRDVECWCRRGKERSRCTCRPPCRGIPCLLCPESETGCNGALLGCMAAPVLQSSNGRSADADVGVAVGGGAEARQLLSTLCSRGRFV